VIVVTKLYATMHFYDVQRYRKLIKVEGLFLVKLTRIAIQDSTVVVSFRRLPFITEFVEYSFDVAAGFSVLKNELRRLSDFPGHFLVPGGCAGWFLRGFGVPGARGGSFGVTNPKRDILVAI
jgi:hypothetical protein